MPVATVLSVVGTGVGPSAPKWFCWACRAELHGWSTMRISLPIGSATIGRTLSSVALPACCSSKLAHLPLAMFLRHHHQTARNPVKSSEARRIRGELRKAFPLLSDSQLAAAWPGGGKLDVQRLDAADRLTVYFVNDAPLVFSTSGRADGKGVRWWPTLYLLHVAPQIIPTLHVYHGVGRKLVGGADLFMPGVVVRQAGEAIGRSWVQENFGKFRAGDMVAVVEVGDGAPWHPVALATWSLSSDDLEYRGMKGRGLDVKHTLDDLLWQQGHGEIPAERPSSAQEALAAHAASIDQAAADAAEAAAQAKRAAVEAQRLELVAEGPKSIKRLEKTLRQINILQDKVDRCGLVPNDDQRAKLARRAALVSEIEDTRRRVEAAMNPAPPETCSDLAAAEALDPPAEEKTPPIGNHVAEVEGALTPAGHVGLAKVEEIADSGAAPAEPEPEPEPAASMDDVLQWAFLLALREGVKDSHLPLLVSTFYAQHMLPAARRLRYGVELQMKQTSYKKMAPFLKAMQTSGIIQVVDVKAGVQHLVSIDRLHSDYISFDTYAHVADETSSTTGASRASEQQWTLPKSGSKKIMIAPKKRGNKHVTVVRYLGRFGLPLDDQLRKDLAKKFSGSVTYVEDPEKTAGPQLIVQGRYPGEVGQFLVDRFGVPPRHFQVEGGKGGKGSKGGKGRR